MSCRKHALKSDPQFNYLEQRKDISKKTEDQKRVVLDIDQRKAELLALEKQTLDSENKRRQIAGQKPYANWEAIKLLWKLWLKHALK